MCKAGKGGSGVNGEFLCTLSLLILNVPFFSLKVYIFPFLPSLCDHSQQQRRWRLYGIWQRHSHRKLCPWLWYRILGMCCRGKSWRVAIGHQTVHQTGNDYITLFIWYFFILPPFLDSVVTCILLIFNLCCSQDNLDGALESEDKVWLFDKSKHPLKQGDVVGLYWDQTALPMLSFTVNGEEIPSLSINRVRPAVDVYPAASVKGNGSMTFCFSGDSFKYPPKNSKFSMIVCASQLI